MKVKEMEELFKGKLKQYFEKQNKEHKYFDYNLDIVNIRHGISSYSGKNRIDLEFTIGHFCSAPDASYLCGEVTKALKTDEVNYYDTKCTFSNNEREYEVKGRKWPLTTFNYIALWKAE